MIIFGGKDSDRDILFNDIYFLGIPTFNWYSPRIQTTNTNDLPSPRLGHASAIYGDVLYVFGGHTLPDAASADGNQEISNELHMLDLQTMKWQKLQADSQNLVKPMAYMAATVDLDQQRLAIFGGLTQDMANTNKFQVTNEVQFLDLATAKWTKPAQVFVDDLQDMPPACMGAQMVHYGGKLYVYSGADPYGTDSKNPELKYYNDLYSFDAKSNGYKWKKETDNFAELQNGMGTMLGQAVRMYNEDAVIFTGGCNSLLNKCQPLSLVKSILFAQPKSHFTDSTSAVDDIADRMGHSLVNVGDAVISFGGCAFGQQCFNDLLIQKPQVMVSKGAYDCYNDAHIMQKSINGLTFSYCKCLDLKAPGLDRYYSGPQCSHET